MPITEQENASAGEGTFSPDPPGITVPFGTGEVRIRTLRQSVGQGRPRYWLTWHEVPCEHVVTIPSVTQLQKE